MEEKSHDKKLVHDIRQKEKMYILWYNLKAVKMEESKLWDYSEGKWNRRNLLSTLR